MVLTKTLKFDDEVLEVLQAMDWKNDGCLGVITGGQLERSLYERLNKALTAMGGKWNRKEGGHVFSIDPRPQVEGLLSNGELLVERDGFFETPRAVVERMLELVPLPENKNTSILEPSAGLGAIAKVILDYGWKNRNLHLVEKNLDRSKKLCSWFEYVYCCDFLEWWTDRFYSRVYMNPPFEEGQDIDHVKRAYQLLEYGGALVSVMSEGPFFRNDHKSQDFREWLKCVGGTSERLPEGSFKESGTMVNARLVEIKNYD